MDAIKNPSSPGAGSPPPELVGRAGILEQVRILHGRVKTKRPEKSILLSSPKQQEPPRSRRFVVAGLTGCR